MSKRVRLLDDLTKYDRRCVKGSLGWADRNTHFSSWSRLYDRFVGVTFDNGAKIDVLWRGLEIIETEEKSPIEKDIFKMNLKYPIEISAILYN